MCNGPTAAHNSHVHAHVHVHVHAHAHVSCGHETCLHFTLCSLPTHHLLYKETEFVIHRLCDASPPAACAAALPLGRNPLCSRSQTRVMCFLSLAASAGRVRLVACVAAPPSLPFFERPERSRCVRAASVRSCQPWSGVSSTRGVRCALSRPTSSSSRLKRSRSSSSSSRVPAESRVA
eukprot:scaffold108784_cov63-Phaeocystis_antarctica.AAC.3